MSVVLCLPAHLRVSTAACTRRTASRAAPAAPNDPEPPALEPVPAGEAAPAAQAAAPAAPPPGGGPDAQGAAAAALAGRSTAHGTPPARGTHPTRALGASPRTAAAAAEGREGAKYRAHTHPSHTHTSLRKPYRPKAAFLEGRPRPVRPPAPKRTPSGIGLPQLQRQREARRVVQEGGDGNWAGRGAGHRSARRAAEGNRGRGVCGGGGQAPEEGAGASSSARGRVQGTGQSARSEEREQGHGQGARASSSGGGQAHGAGQGAGSGQRDTGHGKEHGQGHRKDAGAIRKGKGVGDRGRDTKHGPGWAAGSFFFSSVVCVCMFRCPFSRWAAVPGLVLPVLAGWSPCASLGVLSLVPSGWGVWVPLVVLAGGLLAVGCSLDPPPPPPVFVSWGGPACSSLCLPSAGARTGPHSVWSSGLLLAVAFCLAVSRPHGLGGLCTSWARCPFLPG